MCGIGGILRTDGQTIPDAWLDAIDARIAYRGPDGHGRFRDSVTVQTEAGEKRIEVGLVHRRLSIIDHADGAQPMVSQRGRTNDEGLVAVVFNGCIYNHRELREELEAAGHVFVTDHSDTEVLIHGWRQWGTELCNHLIGMYAFAIWDRTQVKLVLGRDDFGEKPLYLNETESIVASTDLYPRVAVYAFSSEVDALRKLPAPEHVCGDWCRIPWLGSLLMLGYEHWFMPGPDLIDVNSVSPNQIEVFNPAVTEYEKLHVWIETEDLSRKPEPIEHLIENAVAHRLEADVPLGCFLSGGVDSSLIAHFAKRHKPDLHTFSVKMPDARYDESDYAERVADHVGTHHTTLQCDPNPADDLVHLINILGQPFGDSSILPTYWVSKAAREHVKVALSGDGGDELFIGYERYLAARMLARHHRLLSKVPRSMLRRAHPKSCIAKFARLGDMAVDYPKLGVAVMECFFTLEQFESLQPEIVDSRWKCSVDDHDFPDAYFSGLAWTMSGDQVSDAMEELRDHDLERYLPNDLLRKVDTASMACGLEVRCPFLDRDLARTVLAMPIDDLIPGGKRKGLLRNIARRYLPADVVDRPKMGFAIPIGEWFRSDYGSMKTLLLDHLNSVNPFGPISLNQDAVQKYIDEHMRGTYDHGQKLFLLLTLSIWARSLTSST